MRAGGAIVHRRRRLPLARVSGAEEVERLVTIVQNPRQFKVPEWMLNRKKDTKAFPTPYLKDILADIHYEFQQPTKEQ